MGRMAAGQPGLLQQPIRGGRGKPQQMRPTMAPMMAPRPGMHPMPPAAAAAAAAAAGMRPNFKYTPGVRNVAAPMAAAPTPVMAQPPQPQPAVFIQGQEPLTASMLAHTDDDTDIEFVTLHAVKTHGLGITHLQITEAWKKY